MSGIPKRICDWGSEEKRDLAQGDCSKQTPHFYSPSVEALSYLATPWQGTGTRWVKAPSRVREAAPGPAPHLSVPLHLQNEGFLIEERLQPLVHVVVAELLKGRRALAVLMPRVVEAGGVHHGDGGHGEVWGGERPAERGLTS